MYRKLVLFTLLVTFALLMLDLDRFKPINDTLGHSAGDAMLKSVGERLRRCLGPRDLVAHLSADEFAIMQISVQAATR